MVFLSISCAFTVCKFVGSLLPLCDLVIHTPSLLPHSSVLYRNITLVKATVHPEVRNLDFSSWPWSLVFIPMLKYYFHKTDFPSLGDYKAMNQIPCYVWSHCGIVLCNNAELNTTTPGEGWLMLPAAILPYLGTSIGRASSHQTAHEISAL